MNIQRIGVNEQDSFDLIGTPVTVETFNEWKKKFDAEMHVNEVVVKDKLTGKELFERNGKSILENEDASRSISACWWVVLDKADKEDEADGTRTQWTQL